MPDENNNTNTKAVFLIGFMGSGKTTWGRKLANQTGRAFIDLDETIVSETGVAITDYFAQHGECAFRELESRILKNLPLDRPTIVSTGGGAPCYFDNMAWMNKTGITIYFYLPAKALWDRLMQTDVSTRPALNGLSGEALLAFIETKLAERDPYYRQAGHVVNQLSLKLEELVKLAN
ncbi:shikimate kinase [Parapedobacter sp. ISTM3]|uniref:Shikimate kinase n=1 Tax=Parapedobacter luteus TaxID=623280 RepID=A0A1T5AQ91_9SPHI|nr:MULTISPECIES: shikimate kinase [Parapedobacter]MBK1441955.1 shikimate kinase [Parapedobacter sp. ISTM3]SKB37045.1 shikimate kinase [Parapedobacter luteus]